VVVILSDLSWALRVCGTAMDDLFWGGVHGWGRIDWCSSIGDCSWSSIADGSWCSVDWSGSNWSSVRLCWRSVLCWWLGHHSGCQNEDEGKALHDYDLKIRRYEQVNW